MSRPGGSHPLGRRRQLRLESPQRLRQILVAGDPLLDIGNSGAAPLHLGLGGLEPVRGGLELLRRPTRRGEVPQIFGVDAVDEK